MPIVSCLYAGQQVLIVLASVALFSYLVYLYRAVIEQAEMRRATALYKELDLPRTTIPILMPAYSRAAYMREVLDSLKLASNVDKVRTHWCVPPLVSPALV